jgi:hypothetical protein
MTQFEIRFKEQNMMIGFDFISLLFKGIYPEIIILLLSKKL